MKAVLVDDDPLVLFTLNGLLQRRGYEVLSYANPLECPVYTSPACPCLPSAICPDIIISEVEMPKVGGIKFIETVFKKGCKCKHLALIADKALDVGSLNRMAKYGTRFFMKPLDFDELDEWLVRAEQTRH